MNKLKVLMFGWEYAPIVSGGLGVVCRSIAQNLIKQNVKLTFVLPRLPSKISVDNMTLINANETHYQVQADKIIEIETQIISLYE
ncbi:MAG: Starch synthase catalytic domain protein [candidate division WS6 bacterium OLB21]|uniref:starch synthase n=1 Tax=candidate division WS6 bacterium OLB21 TaxID=1617427 RepID=A0A136KEV4_9BACT|nr:MAG: Starch synthase catalytic domain protein [candidate division WS6 bacterium OLB21]